MTTYIEADNPVAALALDELFEEKAGRLLDHPGMGRLGREAGTRELVAHKKLHLGPRRDHPPGESFACPTCRSTVAHIA